MHKYETAKQWVVGNVKGEYNYSKQTNLEIEVFGWFYASLVIHFSFDFVLYPLELIHTSRDLISYIRIHI